MKFKEIKVKGKINEEMSLEELLDVVVEKVKSAVKEEYEINETEEDNRTMIDFSALVLDEIKRVHDEFADYGNETDCVFTQGNYSLLCSQLRYLHLLGENDIINLEELKEIFRFLMITFRYIQEEE